MDVLSSSSKLNKKEDEEDEEEDGLGWECLFFGCLALVSLSSLPTPDGPCPNKDHWMG